MIDCGCSLSVAYLPSFYNTRDINDKVGPSKQKLQGRNWQWRECYDDRCVEGDGGVSAPTSGWCR